MGGQRVGSPSPERRMSHSDSPRLGHLLLCPGRVRGDRLRDPTHCPLWGPADPQLQRQLRPPRHSPPPPPRSARRPPSSSLAVLPVAGSRAHFSGASVLLRVLGFVLCWIPDVSPFPRLCCSFPGPSESAPCPRPPLRFSLRLSLHHLPLSSLMSHLSPLGLGPRPRGSRGP